MLVRLFFTCGLLASALTADVAAEVTLGDVSRSPDVPIDLATGTFALASDVVGHSPGPLTELVDLGALPVATDVTAFHYEPGGDALFSLDAPASLGGSLYLPGDVIRYDPLTGGYSREFDAVGEAVDPASVDALSVVGGDLLLSFDTPVLLEGSSVEPGDLVRWSPGTATLFFDASAEGVANTFDLDAAHYFLGGELLLSFDISGSFGGVDFDDEDILEFDPVGSTWTMAVDGSAQDPEWSVANADAVHAVTAADDNCPGVVNPDQRDTDADAEGDACDTDDDNDGLSDLDETTVHLTDPLDSDSDDDGLSDGDEVLLLGTDPLDPDSDDDGLSDGDEVSLVGTDPLNPDSDADGFCDGPDTGGGTCTAGDNCPFVASANQTNSDALPPGDVCQCGDVTDNGIVDATDLLVAREWLVGATLSDTFVVTRCNLVGPADAGATDCGVGDLFVLRRYVSGAQSSLDNLCSAWGAP